MLPCQECRFYRALAAELSCGHCMFAPPVVVPRQGVGGETFDVEYVRPIVNKADFCSNGQKE